MLLRFSNMILNSWVKIAPKFNVISLPYETIVCNLRRLSANFFNVKSVLHCKYTIAYSMYVRNQFVRVSFFETMWTCEVRVSLSILYLETRLSVFIYRLRWSRCFILNIPFSMYVRDHFVCVSFFKQCELVKSAFHCLYYILKPAFHCLYIGLGEVGASL